MPIKVEQVQYICTFSDRALKLFKNLGQKSLNRGRSIFFKLCSVLASTLTYSCVTGTRFLRAQTGRRAALTLHTQP